MLSIDPGDMDTPLHALAVPDADPATLRRPDDAAADIVAAIAAALPVRDAREIGGGAHDRREHAAAAPARCAAARRARGRLDRGVAARALDRSFARRRSRRGERRRDVAGEPARRASADERADRGPAGDAAIVGRCRRAALDRGAVRRGRLAHAHGGSAAAAGAARRRPRWRSGPLRRNDRANARSPAARPASVRDDPAAFWAAIARHGRPIQYAHLAVDLAPWDVQTPIAGLPVAVEPPSAGFMIDWRTLGRLRERGVGFATLTHAAGLSSTGDPLLDARFPLDEPYAIPLSTARAIERTRRAHGRVIAIGTTVVRALEHVASRHGRVVAGTGVADNRITNGTPLRDRGCTAHRNARRRFESFRAAARVRERCDAGAR